MKLPRDYELQYATPATPFHRPWRSAVATVGLWLGAAGLACFVLAVVEHAASSRPTAGEWTLSTAAAVAMAGVIASVVGWRRPRSHIGLSLLTLFLLFAIG